MGAKALADKPLCPVSRDGKTHFPLRYGKAKTRQAFFVPSPQHHRNRIHGPTRILENLRIIALVTQP